MHLNDTLSSISKDMKQHFFMNENLLNVYLKNLARQNILMKTIVTEIISYCHLHCKKRRKDWLIWKVTIKNQLCYWISRHSQEADSLVWRNPWNTLCTILILKFLLNIAVPPVNKHLLNTHSMNGMKLPSLRVWEGHRQLFQTPLWFEGVNGHT